MPLIETESIVLKSYGLAEADRIVVFLTSDHGVVRGVAKGVKRLKSRYGSSFEPFNTVHLTYYQKEDRELVSIQESELRSSNFASASDPDFLDTYSYIADLLLAIVPPQDPNRLVFRMLKACYSANELPAESLPALRIYFEIWLLKLGGFMPDWRYCFRCGRDIPPGDPASMDSSQHLICGTCSAGRSLLSAPERLSEIFHSVQKLGPADFAAGFTDRGAAAEASLVLKKIIERVLDRSLASIGGSAI